MIWLWLIFFSAGALLACDAATVSGRVRLEASKEKRVQARRDFSGVVIWLESAWGATHTPAPRKARMVQKGKTFKPHVLAIPIHSTVDFPNFDPIFHNAFSNFSGQIFDVGLYPPGTNRTVKFRREGIVRVFCNIHPHMSAVIAVMRTPWFAVTDASGAFQMDNVPPGDYNLRIFHERANQPALDHAVRRLAVAGDHIVPELAISEAGYLAMPHKNKYGKDYPKVIVDKLPYGATAR